MTSAIRLVTAINVPSGECARVRSVGMTVDVIIAQDIKIDRSARNG